MSLSTSLEYKFYKYMFDAPASFRQLQAKFAYQLISKGLESMLQKRGERGEDRSTDIETVSSTFMDYGYMDERFRENPLPLKEHHEPCRYAIQLYHHVAGDLGVKGKHVLEVGSGRGGGSNYVAEYLEPASVTGLDLSSAAIDFCRRAHTADRLTFVEGNAMDLPFKDNSFDVVMNVESSHCYPSFDKFLSEVARVLRPGGLFSWVDARFDDRVLDLERAFALSGLDLVRQTDITQNVVQALDAISDDKKRVIEEKIPRPFRPLIMSGVAVRGTLVYNALESGKLRYLSKVLRKPDRAAGEEPNYPFDWSAAERFDPGKGATLRRFERTKTWMSRYISSKKPTII
ncbi:class I SAM-dependent methyltransferase [Sorangium sp. So ce216]